MTENVPAHRYHIHQQRAAALPEKTNPLPKWQHAGDILARIGLILTAICLGAVTLVAVVSTIWLMTSKKDGNLTQSMSIFTIVHGPTLTVLLTGFACALAIGLICYFAWKYGEFLDGNQGLKLLLGATFGLQVIIILLMQTRNTNWGDSWMIRNFITKALKSGVASIFTGPYKGLFYDARLYFSCYPFQATYFWLLYALRFVFGDFAYMVFQLLNSLATELGVVSLIVLGKELGLRERGQRVLMVLVALCLPMYWLCTFIYGNAMGCGLGLVFLACQAKALTAQHLTHPQEHNTSHNTSSLKWIAVSFVPLAATLCIKATFILFAIGALLTWVVVAVRSRRARELALCIAVIAGANALSGLPFQALRAASGGYEFMGSLTTLNHLELGLRMGAGEFYVSINQGGQVFAPGGWSNYANAIWEEASGNAEIQNRWALAALQNDIAGFLADPAYGIWFFSTKLATEWADPTYQSLYYLSNCILADGTRINPADTSTPLGMLCTVLTFILDGYQTVMFIAALGYLIFVTHRWRHGSANHIVLLLAAVFFTGFGCYLLWEAKAVYVLPFAIVIIPLAAAGIDCTLSTISKSDSTSRTQEV